MFEQGKTIKLWNSLMKEYAYCLNVFISFQSAHAFGESKQEH